MAKNEVIVFEDCLGRWHVFPGDSEVRVSNGYLAVDEIGHHAPLIVESADVDELACDIDSCDIMEIASGTPLKITFSALFKLLRQKYQGVGNADSGD